LEIRKKQRPDIYPIADCIKCQQETESFEHLTCCLQDAEAWIKEEKRIIEETWGKLDPEEKVNCTVEAFTRAILPETLQAKDWRSKAARGIIELRYGENLMNLGFSKGKARKLLTHFLEEWLRFFQNSIW